VPVASSSKVMLPCELLRHRRPKRSSKRSTRARDRLVDMYMEHEESGLELIRLMKERYLSVGLCRHGFGKLQNALGVWKRAHSATSARARTTETGARDAQKAMDEYWHRQFFLRVEPALKLLESSLRNSTRPSAMSQL